MISFLFGQNRYALKSRLRSIADEFAAENIHGAAAPERLSGARLEASELYSLLLGGSLFGERRLVILDDCSQNPAVWSALGEAVQDGLPASTHLVVVEQSPDKRSKTFKTLQKTADLVVEAGPESLIKLLGWVLEEARRRRVELSEPAARRLLELAGPDQERLANELDKLFVHSTIKTELVEDLVEPVSSASVFGLIDAVISRRPQQVGRILDGLRGSEEPSKILALLVGQLHSLAILLASGGRRDIDRLAAEAGIHPYALRNLRARAAGLSLAELSRLIEAADKLDESLKNSRGDEWLLLETVLLRASSKTAGAV